MPTDKQQAKKNTPLLPLPHYRKKLQQDRNQFFLFYFLQKVENCTVVVNPERLAKGLIGGTYARLIINKNDVIII